MSFFALILVTQDEPSSFYLMPFCVVKNLIYIAVVNKNEISEYLEYGVKKEH